MLSEPQTTSADLQFDLLGIRVRVSAWFWLATALLGWQACQSLSLGDQRLMMQLLVIWIAVVFASILVHEMGHALAYRNFGQAAHVVLYHFGGLAVPQSWGRRHHLRPVQRLLVSAAGPLAQLFLAAVVIGILKVAGYHVPFPLPGLAAALGLNDGRNFSAPQAYAFVDFLLYVNIFWPLLNLLPVPPLDGGQIVREGLLAMGVSEGARIASMLGVVVGGVLAWWGYSRGQPFLGVMFAMLAASCFQSLSAGPTPWRRWNLPARAARRWSCSGRATCRGGSPGSRRWPGRGRAARSISSSRRGTADPTASTAAWPCGGSRRSSAAASGGRSTATPPRGPSPC